MNGKMLVLTKIHNPISDEWFSIDPTEIQFRHDIIFIKFYAVYYLEKTASIFDLFVFKVE